MSLFFFYFFLFSFAAAVAEDSPVTDSLGSAPEILRAVRGDGSGRDSSFPKKPVYL